MVIESQALLSSLNHCVMVAVVAGEMVASVVIGGAAKVLPLVVGKGAQVDLLFPGAIRCHRKAAAENEGDQS